MSTARVKTATTFGLNALPIEVEADLSNGLPGFTIVGLPDKAVDESRERVRSAIKNSGLKFPDRRITVNLAPADVKKEGPIFDLAVAVGLLAVSGQVETLPADALFLGELSLDGRLRHTKGILPVVHYAREAGLKSVFLPKENLPEASVITDVAIFPLENLTQLFWHLKSEKKIEPVLGSLPQETDSAGCDFDISLIKGQEHAKRALEIAAAGGHNILFSGPPGSGKTMLARTLASILPPLDFEEMLEVTKIYSISGLLDSNTPLITTRPFRSPHHTSSDISLVGGGRYPRPGEITLAHRGVLFLDELPEFSRSVLEVMRQPLEDGVVNVARAAQSLSFPAQFLLIASQNPCPCGFLGDNTKNCVCTPSQIARYQRKVSGPLLDRIDIHLTVPRVEVEKLAAKNLGESSMVVRARVKLAREVQTKRFSGTKTKNNAEMNQKQLTELTYMSSEASELLKTATSKLGLSARAYFRMIKLGRTIADLAESKSIEQPHIAEALQYRPRQ